MKTTSSLLNWVMPAFAALGLGAMIYTVAAGDKEFPVAAPLAQPATSPFAETVSGAGLVEASTQNVSVAAPLAGIVATVHVQAGDTVKRGMPLFTLDEAPLKAEIASRAAAVQVAEARISEAETAVAEADDQLAKVKELTDPRAISREEVVRRETAARAARARLQSAKAALTQSRAQVKQAEVDLARLTVRAPIGGEVLQLNVRTGEFVSPGEGTPPVILGETHRLHVRVDVDEADSWRFRPGAKAVAHLRGNSTIKVPATFVRTEPFVVPKRNLTGASAERVDTRVLQVLFAFDRKDLPIYVGQQMEVFIEATGSVKPAEPKS